VKLVNVLHCHGTSRIKTPIRTFILDTLPCVTEIHQTAELTAYLFMTPDPKLWLTLVTCSDSRKQNLVPDS